MNEVLSNGWKHLKLGDVVEWFQQDIPEPESAGIEFYVHAENIESDRVTLRHWGNVEDGMRGPTITKCFSKGDLLLGTRSAHLRKASQTPISGVTGEKTLVLRVKGNDLLPELLPFIIHTNSFWDYANLNSSGSVNRFCSWSNIKNYRFHLPPKEEQRRIADIFWAAEDCIVKKEKLVEETYLYKNILMKELLTKGIGHKSFKNSEIGEIPEEWSVKRIGDVCKVVTGGTPSTSHSEYFGGTINWLKSGDIKKTYIYDTEEKITQLGIENSNAKIHPAGGIAIALSGQGFTRGKTAILKEPMACSQSVAIMIPNSELLVSEFLHYNLSNRYMEIRNLTGHQNRSGLNLSIIRNINIALPPFPEQRCIAQIFSQIDDTIEKTQDNINKTKELKKMLINQFLNEELETAVSIDPQAEQLYETKVSE